MLFAIPILSFILPIVFFGCRFGRYPYFSGDKYLSTFISIVVLWMANRYILIRCRARYPLFKEVQKRLLVQSFIMLTVTLIGNNLLHILMFKTIFRNYSVNPFNTDEIISSNSAAIFCLIMIVGIDESIYFMHELKDSVEEKEMYKRESLKAQINALKTQVNPHFLFNNLNTLAAIIPENPQQAVDFVQELSKVYRHILDVKDGQTILVSEELDVLKAYAFLLKTRFGNNINITINIPEDKLQNKIVPLSLQLLMENAIKHNIVSAEKPLQINVFAENGNLVVSNNLQIKNQLNESTGIGLENIRNRYKLLGDKEVKVTENGSRFIVSIPLIQD